MMINRRRVCGGKKGLLPSGYRQVEYIENTSTAYIDTGITLKVDTEIKIDAAYNGIQDSSTLFGVDTPNGQYTCAGNGQGMFFRLFANVGHIVGTVGKSRHIYYFNGSSGYLDGKHVYTGGAPTNSTRTIYLFARNVPNILYGTFKMYTAVIDDARNFIPCINPNNVVGMYDTVNGVFYSSPNGTAFVAGPEV